ncbi:MAG TPA: hypothetical protein VM925_11685 [Labilithrix sp.]|nr:hypothetical protein [Labilithrix sp.]
MQKRMEALGVVALGLVAFAAFASLGCGSTDDTRAASDPTSPPGVPGGGDAGGGNGGGSGEDGGGGGDGGAGGEPAPTPEQPTCPAYTEALPNNASLARLSFSRETAEEFLLGALALRYPVGKALVEGGMSGGGPLGNCLDTFLTDKSSADAVLRHASTTVHECGHFYDLGLSKGIATTYVIRPDLRFTCESGDTTSRGGKTFARSLIKKDAHSAKRRPCAGSAGGNGCDSYASTYLDGQSGEQGYNFVLEEAAQYVNSLATALAFQEQYAGSRASERDGILTFLWYIERYLAMARADYPEAYQLISENECWRKATLTIWDRGRFYLDATDEMSTLGMDDAELAALVNDPVLTAEIDALRKLECE